MKKRQHHGREGEREGERKREREREREGGKERGEALVSGSTGVDERVSEWRKEGRKAAGGFPFFDGVRLSWEGRHCERRVQSPLKRFFQVPRLAG